jgi:hypothetical protein
MRFIITAAILLSSTFAYAATNNCDKWSSKSRYITAIKTVAAAEKYQFAELCTEPKILDIEVQPSHIVTPQGDVIPHTQVQLHMAYQSCLYMVRDSDQVITSGHCYSGW